MKLRNINRGLVLGAVLIVGTAAYVVADNLSFKDNKPKIEQIAKDYTESMAKSNLGDAETVEKQWNDLLDNYFTDYSNNYNYSMTKSDIRDEINERYDGDDNSKKDAEITKCELFPKNIKVSKYGPNGASVSFDFSLYLEYKGIGERHMSFFGIDYADVAYQMTNYDEYSDAELEKKYKDTTFSYTESGTAELYLMETKDGWKIASTLGSYDTSNGSIVDESSEDESSSAKADSTEDTGSSAETSSEEAKA